MRGLRLSTLRLYISAILQTVIAPFEFVLGRRSKSYLFDFKVNAPIEDVWATLNTDDVTYSGLMPVRCQKERHQNDLNRFRYILTIGEKKFTIEARLIDEKPHEHLTFEILKDGTDKEFFLGENYLISTTLAPEGHSTRVLLLHQLDLQGLWTQLMMPFSVLGAARRLRKESEQRAGRRAEPLTTEPKKNGSAIRNAIITGALTFASFLLFFDWTSAAILIALILVHEMGHVIAMRWTGMPVQGIYFVPFMGGLAVSKEVYGNEGQRGFVALMGPGFSILTTALLVYFAHVHPDIRMFAHAAYISAFINGLNLLPVLPLDGGQVFGALLSRSNPSIARGIQQAILVAAIIACALSEMWVLATFGAMVLFSLSGHDAPDDNTRLMPVTNPQRRWLAIAYIATLAFYLAVGLSALELFPPRI